MINIYRNTLSHSVT